ncbi:MAG: acyl-CoA/acyl-ACP dehydrogenase [Fimbriimonadaceae bacterium]|nr:acyl-CoA/acyl-ACP dehydrogenase [Fimbriimonadaceae bacterium]
MEELKEDILAIADNYLTEHVAPNANEIDGSEEALRVALQGLCDRKLMALRRPREYGGPGLDEISFRMFQESVARASGSLAFLQTQHQSAVSMISKGENESLKQRLLPDMADRRLIGIGFSQLRRPGPPMLTATPVGDDFVLNGQVPWVTGNSFFGEFLIGASLPGGEAVFGIVPFSDQQVDNSSILFSSPMRLAAMESPRTMTAELNNWRLTSEDTAFIRPKDWITNNDMINVTLQAWFALGCARAGLDIVHASYEKRKAPFILDAWRQLDEELTLCRTRILENHPELHQRLAARAWAIDLAVRCAHAGVTSSSGAANSIHHNAQRVYREALVYTVSAQTSDIMEATLKRLVARGT